MKMPSLRTSIYLPLGLGLACIFSPFGWGYTHPPLPSINERLSFAFYVASAFAVVRMVSSCGQSPCWLGPLQILFASAALPVLFWFGTDSMFLQRTNVLYQFILHVKTIILVPAIHGVVAVLAVLGEWLKVQPSVASGSEIDIESGRDIDLNGTV